MEQRPYYMGEIEEEGFNCMVEILIGVRGLDNEEIMWYSDLYKRKYNNVTE